MSRSRLCDFWYFYDQFWNLTSLLFYKSSCRATQTKILLPKRIIVRKTKLIAILFPLEVLSWTRFRLPIFFLFQSRFVGECECDLNRSIYLTSQIKSLASQPTRPTAIVIAAREKIREKGKSSSFCISWREQIMIDNYLGFCFLSAGPFFRIGFGALRCH